MQAGSAAILNLEPHLYCDPAVMAREQRAIFLPHWQLIGSEADLDAPGAYTTIRMAGLDVFIIRGTDGKLRGFRNACAHRGAKLLDRSEGQCLQVHCPYHGWQYDTLGRLEATPWFGEPTPFDLASLKLQQISVDSWRGLLFAAIAPHTPLVEQLGDFPEAIADAPIESYRSKVKAVLSAPVNWKVYLDQFVENYHVPLVHAPDRSVHIENYTVMSRRSIVILAAPSQGMFFGGRWIWGWPNWTLSLFSGGMKTSRLEPTSPTSFTIYFEFHFKDSSEEGAAIRKRVVDATTDIFADDVRASQLVQTNYSEANYRPGPLHPVLENGVAYFQSRVRAALSTPDGVT
jgi:choline monooxygenase